MSRRKDQAILTLLSHVSPLSEGAIGEIIRVHPHSHLQRLEKRGLITHYNNPVDNRVYWYLSPKRKVI